MEFLLEKVTKIVEPLNNQFENASKLVYLKIWKKARRKFFGLYILLLNYSLLDSIEHLKEIKIPTELKKLWNLTWNAFHNLHS